MRSLYRNLSAGLCQVERFVDRNFLLFSMLLIISNFALTFFVIQKVPYTEIDWVAYMEEVSGVIKDGELDYLNLRGGTGPLVYPAGFVYIFSALYYLTDYGNNIRRAQYIFALFHSVVLTIVLTIYRLCYKDQSKQNSFPILIVSFLVASRRVISLFVLRLFNDGVQILLMYIAILLFMKNSWSIGCLFFSLSVSVKMNALLFAPGVAVLLCQARGFGGAIRRILGFCLTTQLILGAPFLLHAPKSYLFRAFELSRQFLHKWSVNGAFLEEPVFLNKNLALFLLASHVLILLLFGHCRWTSEQGRGLIGLLNLDNIGKLDWLKQVLQDVEKRVLNRSHVVEVLLTSNFIGISFARTLHYQFYLWYVHSLPLLAFCTNLPLVLKFAVPVLVEIVFNVYPPHPAAAISLHTTHFILLGALWSRKRATDTTIFAQERAIAASRKAGKDN